MRTVKWIVAIASAAFAIYQVVLPVYAFMPDIKERAIHLSLAFVLIFLGGSGRSRKRWFFDSSLTALGIILCLYAFFNYSDIMEQYGIPKGHLQVLMGFLLVALILEAARRAVRPALPLIALATLLYALFGHLIPGYFGHPPYSLSTLGGMFYLTTGGIWGQLLGVSANTIAIFVFLGSFIVYSGGGAGFMKISLRLAGRYVGGPAKVAVVSSALFGSVSGSASANVASTGVFTIPMMKRLGYKPEFAAAVEAVASTGGQIMPPVMGAGAFVMAELIETPYIKIAASAALPAILYFFAAWIGVHFYSLREGFKGLPEEELPSWKDTLKASGFFFVPFGVLLYWMLGGYTPQYAAFWALLSTLPLMAFDEGWKLDLPHALNKLKQAVLNGARQAAFIASICTCAQIIIATIAFTGLGVKASSSLLSLSENSLFLALLLAGITSTILGMEVPTTAAYTVAVVVAGPVLVEMGLHPLVAHMFVFYVAILSAVTPPVCGAVFIASGMADADWIKTAKMALKLSFAIFILPFCFAYAPSLLLLGSPLEIIIHFAKIALALTVLSAGFMGYLRSELGLAMRAILVAAGIMIFSPTLWIWPVGVIAGSLAYFKGSKELEKGV